VKRLRWILALLAITLGGAAGVLGSILYQQYWTQLPPMDGLLDYRPPVATRVYTHDKRLVDEFYFQKRYLVAVNDITPLVQNAFIAAEDSDFRRHRGIDPRGIARAFLANLKAGTVVQGGSTITQQVVKSLVLSPERSYRRKLREIMLSLRLEKELSKDEILYLYLNEIYLGDGNYGVGAAARSYFGKEVAELNAGEAALLAGLPQAPSRYSPTRNPEGARKRQLYVLRRMHEEAFIDTRTYASASSHHAEVQPRGTPAGKVGSYYTEYVRRYLAEAYGREATYHKGFEVYTSMDLDMQAAAERAVRDGAYTIDALLGYHGPVGHLEADELDKRLAADRADESLETLNENGDYEGVVVAVNGDIIRVAVGPQQSSIDVAGLEWKPGVSPRGFRVGDLVKLVAEVHDDEPTLLLQQEPQVQLALLSVEPSTGQVKAMVGGFDFALSEFNRATQARRQPGSAFKPFVYAAALDNGYTPASVILDAPIQYVDHVSVWRPQNYSRRFYGPTTLRRALEKSRNVVTVRVVQDLGVDTVVDYVKRFGFSNKIGRNLSIGLGTSEVSLKDLLRAYTPFADGGILHEPVFITRVEDSRGYVLEENLPEPVRVLTEQTAYLMSRLLRGVVENGTGRGVRALGRPTGGKTGTTNEQRDAWFVGFTPDLLTGVWVGYDDSREIGARGTGGRVAAPVWLDYMTSAHEGLPVRDFEMPPGITCVQINHETGERASLQDTDPRLECFSSGSEPEHEDQAWLDINEADSEELDLDQLAPASLEIFPLLP